MKYLRNIYYLYFRSCQMMPFFHDVSIRLKIVLRVHWRLSTSLKTGVWRNVFWYLKVYIIWEFVEYTIHWDKSQMLKNFLRTNVTKNALFFLLRAPTHHSFTLNCQFLYELKRKVYLSKIVYGISIFDFAKFLFLFKKKHGLFDFTTS